MISLRSAEEIYQYCVENDLGSGTTKGWAIKHFQLLLDNVNPDEEIRCVFIGIHNYKSMTKHDGNYAYAMTDKRIIMAQHKLLGANIQSVNIENINDITLSKKGISGMGLGTICIDTYKETFNVAVNISIASNVYEKVHEVWDIVRQQQKVGQSSSTISNGKSLAEQIKEFKELLDMGIITQEEFEAKKKQLLGI